MAYNLSVPIQDVLAMSYEEFSAWLYYFERRPVGWRDDMRFLTILQALGFKGKAGEIFPSIHMLQEGDRIARKELKEGEILTANLKKSAIFSKMLSAVGGENPFK